MFYLNKSVLRYKCLRKVYKLIIIIIVINIKTLFTKLLIIVFLSFYKR